MGLARLLRPHNSGRLLDLFRLASFRAFLFLVTRLLVVSMLFLSSTHLYVPVPAAPVRTARRSKVGDDEG